MDSKRIEKIRKALPFGGITAIARITGLKYQLCYNAFRKPLALRWDERHDRVIATAEQLLKDRGVILK